MKDQSHLFARLYRLKTIIVALCSLILGIALLVLSKYVDSHPDLSWLALWPIGEIGGTLTAAGLFGVAWDYVDGQDKEAREDERIRRLLKESAPEFRDAVIAGFAETPDNMRGVATNETLDKLATNALALRLGDEAFAAEIYSGLLDQAIRTPERWYDLDVDVRLSGIPERDATGVPRAASAPLFEVLVTWDYTLVPSHQIQKFACVSNRDEFRELLSDVPATSTWYLSPNTGMQPNDQAAYELLQYSVNGEDRPIRRSASKTRQAYTVDLGEDVVRAGKPVKIRHSLRAVITREGHWLQIAMTQPTKNLQLSLDYTDTDIHTLRVTDLVSSAKQPWVTYLPQEQPARVVSLEVPGWLLPQAQVTFIWTLDGEATGQSPAVARPDSASPEAA